MKRQKANVWAGLVVLLYALILLIDTLSLPYYTKLGPGPGFFPLWISGFLIILSIMYIVTSAKQDGTTLDEIIPKGRSLINSLSVLAAILVFMLIIDIAGFIVACTALMFIVLIGQYKWYFALSISASTSVVLLVLFQYVMDIPLPAGIFSL